MEIKNFWGRFFTSGEWGIWHLIGKFSDKNKAIRKFQANTLYNDKEIEVTEIEPEKYAGRKRGI